VLGKLERAGVIGEQGILHQSHLAAALHLATGNAHLRKD
jgi:hypothetical protein